MQSETRLEAPPLDPRLGKIEPIEPIWQNNWT